LVEEKTRVPYSHQILKFGTKELIYGKMCEYCMQNESTFILTYCSSEVIVKTLTGKTLVIGLDLSQPVSYLKCKIQVLEGIPVCQQRLIFAGILLEDDRTFTAYNIQTESTLFLKLQLRGGGCWGSSDETIQGATTLQGISGQKFKSYSDKLYLDETKKLTIYARLVGTEELEPKYHNETATTLRGLSQIQSVPPPPAPVRSIDNW
jgi:hypothetical protein